ncbi:MAG: MotA/TolQ/ExbB proton channel family protein [Thiotrichales bacterium]|nr:MotA/TolQ/ExbB proton channel family protein [Thiotrichales bacterium]
MTKHTIIIFFSLILPASAYAQSEVSTLDELLKQVKTELAQEEEQLLDRENKFKSARDKQALLLKQAQDELDKQEQLSEKLRAEYDINEREIDTQNHLLKERAGALGELHGVVRQIATDVDAIINTSIVSAQYPERDLTLDKLTGSKELPSIAELEALWILVLDEMAQSSKVVKFNSRVITSAGDEQEKSVTRIGVFNAVADGRFLRFLPESKKLVEPAGQPPARLQNLALQLERASSGLQAFPVDPTRGTRLALYILEPDFRERVQQGGLVGYIIIAVAIIGLLIALERFIALSRMEKNVNRQLRTKQAGDNPLGRIMQVYENNPDVDTETLEYKLDEAILKELPKLQRGLGALSLLAAIAPLLGLLGTVIGIIETFQSITLFGTGDPRAMSDGISQALVTTVMGLVVAIPLLLLHSFLSSRSNRLTHLLDEKSKSFVALLAEINRLKAANV